MAKSHSGSIGPKMSRAELTAGILYLPFFTGLLSILITIAAAAMKITLTRFQLNVVWFSCNGLFCTVAFGRFLGRSFRAIRVWPLISSIILCAVLFHGGNLLLNLFWQKIGISPVRFNDSTIAGFAAENFPLTAAMIILIAPVVEELLIRGVIFGGIYRKSRAFAYLLSIFIFCAIHVWSYYPEQKLIPVLLAAAEYLPASIALCWCYERAKTIWAPIFLHMLINGVSMGLIA